MSPTLALIRSAFGPTTTLYDALQSTEDACQADLKKAYRKMALKYHPDKQPRNSKQYQQLIKEATSKFQAVSAAYEVLMDTTRRSVYDATGGVTEEDDGLTATSSYEEKYRRSNRRRKRETETNTSDEYRQRRWDDFFHSVFNDIITADSRYGDVDSYRRSRQEHEDVLKYYVTCKGDLQMVLKCVIHGTEKDINRWRKNIITPAILKGDIEDYCGIKDAKNTNADTFNSSTRNARTSELVDSDEDNDDYRLENKRKKIYNISSMKKKRLKKYNTRRYNQFKDSTERKSMEATATLLKDSADDAEDDCNSRSGTIVPLSMNRRDKMEYRVAKKLKLKANREIEIASIMKSKTWSSRVATKAPIGREHRERSGTFNNVLLSNLEKKYAKVVNDGVRVGKRRKK